MAVLAVLAALLLGAAAVIHSVLGERYILVPLLRRGDLPRIRAGDHFLRRTIRVAWHATSLAWAGFGALVLWPAHWHIVMAATFGASSLMVGVATGGRHLAWVVFAAVAALVLFV